MEFSGLLLMFLLGLRHGLDPDHIAIIDNVAMRYTKSNPWLARWTGTLFAIGHGSIVTAIAVMISIFSHSWVLPDYLWLILEWLPGLILIAVGLLNLRVLLGQKQYKPHGLKLYFIPKKIRNSSNPLAIVLMGILFAMVFDTNTQAAAWAYTAGSSLTAPSALLLGLTFSLGMVLTDTLDSRILFMLMSESSNTQLVLNYRRKIGWVIVYLSLIVGSYKIATVFFPAIELGETVSTLIGMLFVVAMLVFYAIIIYTNSANKKIHGH